MSASVLHRTCQPGSAHAPAWPAVIGPMPTLSSSERHRDPDEDDPHDDHAQPGAPAGSPGVSAERPARDEEHHDRDRVRRPEGERDLAHDEERDDTGNVERNTRRNTPAAPVKSARFNATSGRRLGQPVQPLAQGLDLGRREHARHDRRQRVEEAMRRVVARVLRRMARSVARPRARSLKFARDTSPRRRFPTPDCSRLRRRARSASRPRRPRRR